MVGNILANFLQECFDLSPAYLRLLQQQLCLIITKCFRNAFQNLDGLGFPAWDLVAVRRYRASPQLLFRSRPTLGLLQSRGCPWRCWR